MIDNDMLQQIEQSTERHVSVRTHRTNQLQKLMLRWNSLHPYNVVDWIELKGAFDPLRLQQAARFVLDRENLTSVSVDDHLKVIHASGATAQIPVKSIETSWIDIERYAAAELNRPFDPSDRSPIRLAGTTTRYGQRIVLTFPHWLMDGYAAGNLFAHIVRRYLSLPEFEVGEGDKVPIGKKSSFQRQELSAARWPFLAMETVRSAIALRSCYSSCRGERDDLRVDVNFPSLTGDLLDRLRHFSRANRLTVNDVLLASLAEAILAETPERSDQARRRRVAISSAVDLRQRHPELIHQMPGVHLGFFRVICDDQKSRTFEDHLDVVQKQTARAKRKRTHCQSLAEIAYSNWMWNKLPERERVRHFMNNHPVAAGISNLRHPFLWWSHDGEPIVEHYQRAVPTGMMTPLAIGVTTVEGKISISATKRLSGYDSRQADAIVDRMIERLERL